MPARRYSLEDVRRGYTAEKAWGELQGDFFCWLIYRPLSFSVATVMLNLGVPILTVTLSSAILALLMFAIAWNGGAYAYIGVAALAFCYPVLDCVDGNMARTLHRPTKLGGIVDGTVDMAYQCLLILSVGLLVAHRGGGLFGDHAATASLSAALVMLLNRQTRDNYAANFSGRTYFTTTPPDHISPLQYTGMALLGLEHGYLYAILLGGLLGALDWVLAGMIAYIVVVSTGAIALTFVQAAREDRAKDEAKDGAKNPED